MLLVEIWVNVVPIVFVVVSRLSGDVAKDRGTPVDVSCLFVDSGSD